MINFRFLKVNKFFILDADLLREEINDLFSDMTNLAYDPNCGTKINTYVANMNKKLFLLEKKLNKTTVG